MLRINMTYRKKFPCSLGRLREDFELENALGVEDISVEGSVPWEFTECAEAEKMYSKLLNIEVWNC